jgi:Putative Flp pilus-assembly TadE/G-like
MRKEIIRFFRNLWDDTNGLMVPYIGVLLILVIIPLVVLAVDGARFQSLQTQMQAAADAAALAGAAELNGQPGAMSRATDAINNYLSNYLSGMGNANAVQFSAPAYYSALPPADQLPSNGTPASTDDEARFVLVTATPVTVPIVLPGGSFSGGARAVAGMFEDICGTPPPVIYICNPWEGTGPDLTIALSDASKIRQQLKLTNDGTNRPGSFGWIVPPDGDLSVANLQDWISRNVPNTCYRPSVNLNTGARPTALSGFNKRFNIGADSTHSPDINVQPNHLPPPPPPPLPNRDTCFTNPASCSPPFRGNGLWNCGSYWTTYHSTTAPTGCTDPTTTLSRYDIYSYEIAHPDPTIIPGVPGRRVLPVPVINCIANSSLMGNGQQNATIPVELAAFAKFLITEPVDMSLMSLTPPQPPPLFGEFTGPLVGKPFMGPLTDTNKKVPAFQNVKLYR